MAGDGAAADAVHLLDDAVPPRRTQQHELGWAGGWGRVLLITHWLEGVGIQGGGYSGSGDRAHTATSDGRAVQK